MLTLTDEVDVDTTPPLTVAAWYVDEHGGVGTVRRPGGAPVSNLRGLL